MTMMLKTEIAAKLEEIRAFVIQSYLETAKFVFIADVAEKFNTSPTFVRRALEAGFDFDVADRWSGSNFAGRYIQSPCVEPSKALLVGIILRERQKGQ